MALPNLDVQGVIECQYAAIAAPSDDRVRACTRKIANGDSDLIKVRFAALSGLKPDISPRFAKGALSCSAAAPRPAAEARICPSINVIR